MGRVDSRMAGDVQLALQLAEESHFAAAEILLRTTESQGGILLSALHHDISNRLWFFGTITLGSLGAKRTQHLSSSLKHLREEEFIQIRRGCI